MDKGHLKHSKVKNSTFRISILGKSIVLAIKILTKGIYSVFIRNLDTQLTSHPILEERFLYES